MRDFSLMRFVWWPMLLVAAAVCSSYNLVAQQPEGQDKRQGTLREADAAPITTPDRVEIDPTAEDHQIEMRLSRILKATEWYSQVDVKVDEGVVFLTGLASREEHRKWATELATKTRDVVAVVNRMTVAQQPFLNLAPAWKEVDSLGRGAIQSMPLIAIAFVILMIGWALSGLGWRWSKKVFNYRFKSDLLANVAARAMAILIVMLTIYIALRVTGLTQVAATLLGGTGLFGLIIGIAFRDIAENFLASVLISIQRPFALGDNVIMEGHQGYVQSVTMRGTLLMTLDGNYVQIPNAQVYKSVIQNLSANPNQRLHIELVIGYRDSISRAQEIILKVLREHEAVLDEPEPMVLVDALGQNGVTLRIHFWIDGVAHSPAKVRSSLLRLVKRSVQDAGFSFQQSGRELVVVGEVPVRIVRSQNTGHPEVTGSLAKTNPHSGVESKSRRGQDHTAPTTTGNTEPNQVESTDSATMAENGLKSEAAEIESQASNGRTPETGRNLLANPEVR
jgi:small conductance mechanosensitive channel